MPHDDRVAAPPTYVNAQGDRVELTGKTQPTTLPATTGGWATRKHPDQPMLAGDEAKQRASYLVDKRRLAPFLVPHRFEAKEAHRADGTPTNWGIRKRLAYGIGLNQAYLSEVLGQIRRTPSPYRWGTLGQADDEPSSDAPPEGTLARELWYDATRNGVTWANFFEGEVLEHRLTSPGGFVVVDIPGTPADSRAEEERMGKRPYFRYVPWSDVEDWGMGEEGLRWIKLRETEDVREPKADDQEHEGFRRLHVLYELRDGATVVSRYDDEGEPVGDERDLGVVRDVRGRPIVPLIPVRFGTHPDAPYAGAGLLMGLDDIVLDLWNLVSEMREEFRDIVFDFLVHVGPNGPDVRQELEQGQRFVDLGAAMGDDQRDIKRVGSGGEAIQFGEMLFRMALQAWALTAKRKAAEAVEGTGEARSGVSLEAEFELDLKPLLVRIAETQDELETNCMFVAAQLADRTVQEADRIGVARETDFRLEDEAGRIARIVGEARDAGLAMTAEAIARFTMRWYESAGLDLDSPVEGEGEEARTLRDVLEDATHEMAEAIASERVNRGTFLNGLRRALPGREGLNVPPLPDDTEEAA